MHHHDLIKELNLISHRVFLVLICGSQDICAAISSAEIARRVNCARGKRHFTKWTNAELNEAIKVCGLAVSKYPSKRKKCGIVHHLSITDLPTDMGKV